MRPKHSLKIWLSGLGIALSASATMAQSVEQAGLRRGPVAVPCQPACPVIPIAPCPPTQTPTDPSQQPPVAPPDNMPLPPAPGFAEAPSAGTRGGAALSPNMMGDLLGARSITATALRNMTVTFPNAPPASGGVLVIPNTGAVQIAPLPGKGGSTYNGGPYTQQLAGVPSYVQPLAGNQAALTPAQASATQAVLQSVFDGKQLTAAQIAALPPHVRAQLPQIQSAVNSELTRATRGLAGSVQVGPVSGQLLPNGSLQYTTLLTGQSVLLLPGSSSVVGRVKLAEDNNPLPRDRVIFNYDYFDNVPFTANGVNVNRYQVGIEKTFLDGRASLEVRLPFAGTVSSTSTQGLETTSMEIGNLRFALKYLWSRSETVNFTTGLAVSLPTADDTIVMSQLAGTPNQVGSAELYRFKNESVQIEPFAAILLTPTDRLFGQIWSSLNIDTSGGDLTYNTAVFGGDGSDKIWDLPYLAVDTQIGYWIVRNQTGRLRGVAPFLELHWNYALANEELEKEVNKRAAREGLTFAASAMNEVNLTAGVTTQIGDNLLITVGGTAPMLKKPDRTFDGQLGVRVNWLYGRTAQERSAAYLVSGF